MIAGCEVRDVRRSAGVCLESSRYEVFQQNCETDKAMPRSFGNAGGFCKADVPVT